MSVVFRVILVLVSIGTWFYISSKLKKAQMDTHDTIFWILFSLILIVISIFPRLADHLAHLLGIYSTVNMVFLIIIFALLIRVFLLTVKISQMEHKIRILVEELALQNEEEKAERQKDTKAG